MVSSTSTPAGAQSTPPVDERVSAFDLKYPPDEYKHELDPEARVWTLYKERATAEDSRTLKIWNGTVDQLLLFVRRTGAYSRAR